MQFVVAEFGFFQVFHSRSFIFFTIFSWFFCSSDVNFGKEIRTKTKWCVGRGGENRQRNAKLNNLQLIVSRLIFFFIGSAVLTIGLQKFAESLQCALTVVVNNFVITLPEQFDGGEALDLDIFQFIACWAHLGDDDLVVISEFFSQFIPSRSQLFAMTCN